jgi:hypothetical protein
MHLGELKGMYSTVLQYIMEVESSSKVVRTVQVAWFYDNLQCCTLRYATP